MVIIRKLIGFLLLIAAIVGLVISIGGIVLLWQVEAQASQNVQSTIELLGQTLETTSQGLTITETALKSSVNTISSLQSTVVTTVNTVKSSGPMVDEISLLMENDLPGAIEATEASLRSAAASARVIDGLLGTLSSIPLVGSGLNYNPDVPLSKALEDVADNLSGLPESFSNMTMSLQKTSSNIETFEADLTVVAESIGEIERSVADYEIVIKGYQQSLEQVKAGMDNLKDSIPTYVRFLVLALTVFFVWMAIAQLGLLTQGWELLTENAAKTDREPEDRKSEREAEPADPPAKTDSD